MKYTISSGDLFVSYEGEPEEIALLVLKLKNIENTKVPEFVSGAAFAIPDDGEEWKK